MYRGLAWIERRFFSLSLHLSFSSSLCLCGSVANTRIPHSMNGRSLSLRFINA
jgi:hypothetical protein